MTAKGNNAHIRPFLWGDQREHGMSQVLTHLIYSSFSAAVLILAVLIVQLIVAKRAPRWIVCLLWGMVGVRLLIPFSIESELSLLPEIELSEAESDTESADLGNLSEGSFGESITESDESVSDTESSEQPQESSGAPSVPSEEETYDESERVESAVSDEPSEETSAESIVSMPAAVESEASLGAESAAGESSDSTQDGVADMGRLAQGIWLCGALALVLYAGIHYVMLYRRVAVFAPAGEGVRRCERIDMPFVLGVFRPRVYLPYGLDAESEKYIIAHERAHIRRFDHVTKIVAFAALALHWFNPVVWLAFVLFCRDIEYACDEKVVRDLPPEERKKYASALLLASIKK